MIAVVHGVYYLATGVAPFLSRRAFELITGRKHDWWLVQTVGLLVAPLGALLTAASLRGNLSNREKNLAITTAVSLGSIETVYALRRRISLVYLLDAVLQGIFAAGLAMDQVQNRRSSRSGR
jgi:hypothetical protein